MTDITNQQLLDGVTDQLASIVQVSTQQLLNILTKQMATKDDLKAFATKDDLKGFATKDDLKGFATKDDLKGFATKDDLKDLKDELVHGLTNQLDKMSNKMATNKDLQELGQHLGAKQKAMQRDIDIALGLLGGDIVAKSTLENHEDRLQTLEAVNISSKSKLKLHYRRRTNPLSPTEL